MGAQLGNKIVVLFPFFGAHAFPFYFPYVPAEKISAQGREKKKSVRFVARDKPTHNNKKSTRRSRDTRPLVVAKPHDN